MPENSPNQVAISQTKTVPDQLRADTLQKTVQAEPNLNAFQRRQLMKQLFRTTFEQRREQFQASLEVDKYRLGAQVDLVKTKIDTEKDTIALSIREEFVTTLANLGMRVEMSQLEFLTEFGVRLKSFRDRLETQDVDSDEKQRILQMSRDSFDRIYRRLMDLTNRIAPCATGI